MCLRLERAHILWSRRVFLPLTPFLHLTRVQDLTLPYGCRLQYRSHTILYGRVWAWMRIRWSLTKAHPAAISFEVVEWSEFEWAVIYKNHIDIGDACYHGYIVTGNIWAGTRKKGVNVILGQIGFFCGSYAATWKEENKKKQIQKFVSIPEL